MTNLLTFSSSDEIVISLNLPLLRLNLSFTETISIAFSEILPLGILQRIAKFHLLLTS